MIGVIIVLFILIVLFITSKSSEDDFDLVDTENVKYILIIHFSKVAPILLPKVIKSPDFKFIAGKKGSYFYINKQKVLVSSKKENVAYSEVIEIMPDPDVENKKKENKKKEINNKEINDEKIKKKLFTEDTIYNTYRSDKSPYPVTDVQYYTKINGYMTRIDYMYHPDLYNEIQEKISLRMY